MTSNSSSLCEDCSQIRLESLCEATGHRHMLDATNLVSRSYHCALCSLFRQARDQNLHRKAADDELAAAVIAPRPIILHGIRSLDEEDSQNPQTCQALALVGIEVHIPTRYGDDDYDAVRINLSAEDGSKAKKSETVVGSALFHDAGSPEALNLVKDWLKRCLSNHPSCASGTATNRPYPNASNSYENAQLPTRIIDLGVRDGSGHLRLVETHGARAPYAALSHCWGKHKFLVTTKGSVSQHLQEISFADLPKTFQEAVVISRKVGLNHLWIDSLCIIQDDDDDWRRESAVMGQVYKNATVTIAASGAKDGRDGCFVPRPRRDTPAQLPHLKHSDEQQHGSGVIYAGLFPSEKEGGLDLCVLGQRAWITQEWILSPRIIHYTTSRMLWSCRTLMKSEDGEPMVTIDEQRLFESAKQYHDYKAQPDLTQPEEGAEIMEEFYSNWCDLISKYTSRALTYERDKPIAILGLAEEVAAAAAEHYVSGILHSVPAKKTFPLKSEAPEIETRLFILQLFWFAKADMARPTILQISEPSWSWTSTIGPISYHSPARIARSLASRPRLEQIRSPGSYSQAICVTATIRKWLPSDFNLGSFTKIIPNAELAFAEPLLKNAYLSQFFSESSFVTRITAFPRQATLMMTRDEVPAGWISFDLGVLPLNVDIYLAALSKNEIDSHFDGYNVIALRERSDTKDGKQEKRFTRLGVGEILSDSFFDNIKMEEIWLI